MDHRIEQSFASDVFDVSTTQIPISILFVNAGVLFDGASSPVSILKNEYCKTGNTDRENFFREVTGNRESDYARSTKLMVILKMTVSWIIFSLLHCVKRVQIRSFFWSVFGHFSRSVSDNLMTFSI